MPLESAPVAPTPRSSAACGSTRTRRAAMAAAPIPTTASRSSCWRARRSSRSWGSRLFRQRAARCGRAHHPRVGGRDRPADACALRAGRAAGIARRPRTGAADHRRARSADQPCRRARRPAGAGRARIAAHRRHGQASGHLFHPAEGAGGGMLFGHGPVFRDFYFALDARAAARVVARVPTSLVPMTRPAGSRSWRRTRSVRRAGRSRRLGCAARTPLARILAQGHRTRGLIPFDLLAAAYALEPSWFLCTPARAWVGKDSTMIVPWRSAALLIEPSADGPALYCGRVRSELKGGLMTAWER